MDTFNAFSGFSWMPDFMHSQSHDRMACTKPHPNPVVTIPIFNTLKRKRTSDWSNPSLADSAPVKKLKRETTPQELPISEGTVQASSGSKEAVPAVSLSVHQQTNAQTVADAARQYPQKSNYASFLNHSPELRARAMDKIEAQINLEILLKHNELRLIEQEIGKCTIALEQLRRCRHIPYPSQETLLHRGEQNPAGTGIGPDPLPGFSRPEYPAPYGVTDGPYSRHYARWLLPDPKFDPSPLQPLRTSTGRKSISGRTTRGSAADFGNGGLSRAPRASTASKLQLLSTTYPAPKDRNSPLIATRPSDGKSVKLVCKFCGKDNISSMQGFLNHCRIQHKHEYASHGAAAEDCGVVCEEGEMTIAAPAINDLHTPVSATTPSVSRPLVHPLITAMPQDRHSNAKIMPIVLPSVASSSTYAPSSDAPRQQYRQVVPPLNIGQGPFVGSSLTPRLSALLEKRGISGNLKVLVEQAKDKSDYDNICEQLPSDDEQEDGKNAKPKPAIKPKSRRGTAPVSGVNVPPRLTNGAGTSPSRLQISTQYVPTPSDLSARSTRFVDTPSIMSGTIDFGNRIAFPDSSISTATHTPSYPTSTSFHLGNKREYRGSEATDTSDDARTMNLSPHTVDTNPGLTDNDDGESEDDYEDGTSEHGTDGDEHAPDQEPDVTVREHDEGHGHHTIADVEGEASEVGKRGTEGLRGGEGLRLGSLTPGRRRRGRPSKKAATAAGSEVRPTV